MTTNPRALMAEPFRRLNGMPVRVGRLVFDPKTTDERLAELEKRWREAHDRNEYKVVFLDN